MLPPQVGEAFASALGQPAPRRIGEAGHFLQEDQGAADRRRRSPTGSPVLGGGRGGLRLVGRGLGDDRLGGRRLCGPRAARRPRGRPCRRSSSDAPPILRPSHSENERGVSAAERTRPTERLRHEDVEAPELERLDDGLGDVLGLWRLTPLSSLVPAISSVLTNAGITTWTSTPVP